MSVDDTQDETLLNRLASHAGIDLMESRDKSNRRAREVKPNQHASVVGRILAALGSPIGTKNPSNEITLPEYLHQAPSIAQREFIQNYVYNRGNRFDEKATIIFREERAPQYHRSLAQFMQDVTDASVTVSENNLILSADAARVIDSWPDPLSDLD